MRVALLSSLLVLPLALMAQAVPVSTGAAVVPASAGSVTNLAAVSVSGAQPGPGLWKISKGDHVLWVLGVLSPLPQRMQWQSNEVEQVIGQSREVLEAPTVDIKLNTGLFGKLFLLPSAYSARKNENGKTLQQVLPPALYARWLVLKQKYMGDDHGIERWRPIFAAQELYKKAIRANDLNRSGGVKASIDALAQKYQITPTPSVYQVVLDHPHQAIVAFKSSGIDDIACFEHTLDSIEHDLPLMTARANAWATGDLDALRKLPDSEQRNTCINAITAAGFAHQLGLDDVPAREEANWLAAARAALEAHTQSFAMLPMGELLAPTGYLGKLKLEGYVIQSPDDQNDDGSAPPSSGSSAIH